MWATIVGVISFLLGSLYLFSPEMIKKIDKIGKRIIISSDKMMERRKLFSFFYFAASIILILVGAQWGK